MDAEPTLQNEFEALRHDLKSFFETRYELLRSELKSTVNKVGGAAVLMVAAALFGFIGLLLLGTCIALAIALGFGAFQNQVGLVWGFFITGGCGVIFAGILGMAGKSKLKADELTPKRTLRVLKRDQESFQQGGERHGEQPATRRSA